MNMQHLQSFEDQTRLNSNYMKELEHTNCKNIRHASRKKCRVGKTYKGWELKFIQRARREQSN